MSQRDGQLNDEHKDSHKETEQPSLKRKEYEEILRGLQEELCSLQEWVKATGQRIIVVFEGRDAAGKGGTIKAITERVSPSQTRKIPTPGIDHHNRALVAISIKVAHDHPRRKN
jgi:polyphosphate kinase